MSELPERKPHRIRSKAGAQGQHEFFPLGDREFICRECRARCTVTADSHREVGHMGGCGFRDEGLPSAVAQMRD